jgi:hypothetical protein
MEIVLRIMYLKLSRGMAPLYFRIFSILEILDLGIVLAERAQDGE